MYIPLQKSVVAGGGAVTTAGTEFHRHGHAQLSDKDVRLHEQDLAVDLTFSPVVP